MQKILNLCGYEYMILKDRKIRVWCKREHTSLYELIKEDSCSVLNYPFSFFGEKIGKNIHIKERELNKRQIYKGTKKKISIPSKIKCPDCGKRFNPKIRECEDKGCWHVYLPAHKKEAKIKKNKK